MFRTDKDGIRLLGKFLALSILVCGIASCKKEPATVEGGTVRLIVNVNHHGYPIANATVFRKNGTLDFPGTDTTLYDSRYVADASGNLIIADIGNGNKDIVLYAKGYDPAFDTTTITPVWGYQYFTVSTATGEDRDVTVTIPVSE